MRYDTGVTQQLEPSERTCQFCLLRRIGKHDGHVSSGWVNEARPTKEILLLAGLAADPLPSRRPLKHPWTYLSHAARFNRFSGRAVYGINSIVSHTWQLLCLLCLLHIAEERAMRKPLSGMLHAAQQQRLSGMYQNPSQPAERACHQPGLAWRWEEIVMLVYRCW